MAKILITGANGYLGGRIAEYLLNQGHELHLGVRSQSSAHVLQKLLPEAKTLNFDLQAPDSFPQALKNQDCVIHLAALNHQQCLENPSLAQQVNSEAVGELLVQTGKAGIQHFIYASTFHVYEPGEFITEESPTGTKSVYAQTHLDAEKYIEQYCLTHKLSGTVLRLSNALGPPLSPEVNAWSLVANDLCRQAISAKKLQLQSHGLQERNFIAISDLSRAFAHLITSKSSQYDFECFNLGGENAISIRSLAQSIQHLCLQHCNYRPELIIPEADAHAKQQQTLTFSSAKFLNTGFTYEKSVEDELKENLLFCQRHFS
ncbi:MAG: SDR family oxidoreductase [Planctomycetes bacterium]|nr:SDR family oxidoreductase [Planctomycetota bacterium]